MSMLLLILAALVILTCGVSSTLVVLRVLRTRKELEELDVTVPDPPTRRDLPPMEGQDPLDGFLSDYDKD